jgi:hypothetical protein
MFDFVRFARSSFAKHVGTTGGFACGRRPMRQCGGSVNRLPSREALGWTSPCIVCGEMADIYDGVAHAYFCFSCYPQ